MKSIIRSACVTGAFLSAFLTCAQAEFQARSASGVIGEKGAAARQGGAVGGGDGSAAAGYRSGFDTENAQGRGTRYFRRNVDGTTSAGRQVTATNKQTGVTYNGSTTWEKGSGISREASCKDASGNTVTCGEGR